MNMENRPSPGSPVRNPALEHPCKAVWASWYTSLTHISGTAHSALSTEENQSFGTLSVLADIPLPQQGTFNIVTRCMALVAFRHQSEWIQQTTLPFIPALLFLLVPSVCFTLQHIQRGRFFFFLEPQSSGGTFCVADKQCLRSIRTKNRKFHFFPPWSHNFSWVIGN